jgi:hypothetical protein
LNELTAKAAREYVTWPSRDTVKAMRKMLLFPSPCQPRQPTSTTTSQKRSSPLIPLQSNRLVPTYPKYAILKPHVDHVRATASIWRTPSWTSESPPSSESTTRTLPSELLDSVSAVDRVPYSHPFCGPRGRSLSVMSLEAVMASAEVRRERRKTRVV